jgi:hypothetical protein
VDIICLLDTDRAAQSGELAGWWKSHFNAGVKRLAEELKETQSSRKGKPK